MNITVVKKHNEKKTYTIVFFTFVAVTLLFAMAQTSLLSPAFWQGMGALLFCVAAFYISKFRLTEYTYTLTDNDFIIVKNMGKRSCKVCHLDNETITALYSKKEWREHKKSRQISCVYNYNASPLPDFFYVLVFELDSKKSAVMFEASEEMKEAILNIIHAPKENQ